MNWLFEIFSSTSDQARLITTLIAAFIAIVVVFANQWFTSKRTRNVKIIEKIEETYLSVIKLEELFFTIHGEIVTNYHVYNPKPPDKPYKVFDEESGAMKVLHIDELNAEFYRTEATVTMLSGLYFSELKESIATIKNNHQELYSFFCESETLSEYLKDGNEQRKKIKEMFKVLYTSLQLIMNRYMH